MHESEKWKWGHSVVSDSSRPRGPQPTRLLRPWGFPGKSTGVGCHTYPRTQQFHSYTFPREKKTSDLKQLVQESLPWFVRCSRNLERIYLLINRRSDKLWQSHTRKCSSAQRRMNNWSMLQPGWISNILAQMGKNTRQKCVCFIILFKWRTSEMTEISTAGAWEVGVVFKGQSNFMGGRKAWHPFSELFLCLTAPGLSWSTCDHPVIILWFLLRQAGSLVAACELLAAARGI